MDSYQPKFDDSLKEISSQSQPGHAGVRSDVSRPDAAYVSQGKRSAQSLSTQADARSQSRGDLPPGTSLASIFRYHMGIENDENLVPSHLAKRSAIDPIATGSHPGRRAVNLGIYNRAIREERTTAWEYQVWSVVINSALGLQIIFAAILTALGAGNGPHDVVALFGALNTIIAGFLTYLKGTGLPMRMKYFHNQWLKLRAYIEQRERDFASDDLTTVHRIGYAELMEEIEVIEKMYQNIRKDVERHTPDNFGGSKEVGDQQAPGEGASNSDLAKKGLHALRNRLAKAKLGAAESSRRDVESQAEGATDERMRQRGQYDATDEQSQVRYPGGGVERDVETSRPEEAESTSHDVFEVSMARLRQTQARALEAQYQAESRVKELEQKLAALNSSAQDK